MTDSNNNHEPNYVGHFGGDVAVSVNNLMIESRRDGSISVKNTAGETLFARSADQAPAADKTDPEVGDRMADGTIFAGASPDTGRPMYTTPADAPDTMKWNRAMEYASGLNAHKRRDWRVPSENELNVLFNNRAAIGGFRTFGVEDESWYWSSQQDKKGLREDIAAVARHFADDGERNAAFKAHKFAVRCVCG